MKKLLTTTFVALLLAGCGNNSEELEEENRRLKRMYAEVSMDKEVLQELIEKSAKA